MAASTIVDTPVMAEKPSEALANDGTEDLLRAVALALGMNPDSKNKLQSPDANFIQEMISLPINFAGMPDGTDVKGMRRWVSEVFANEALVTSRRNIGIQRRRSRQDIQKAIVPVKCSSTSDESFDLWTYQAAASQSIQKRPAILMFHGGGWIHGDPSGDEFLAEIFASELDAFVIGVDYRLAPEHKFPEPLDDCAEALNWVIENASDYNIDINRTALWGASAGGNLAAALAVRWTQLQDQDIRPALSLVSLVVPVTAHPQAFATFERSREIPLGKNELLFADAEAAPAKVVEEFEKLLEMYLGSTDISHSLVSPLVAPISSRHPPTHITVAACDYLRPQGQAYAEVLRSSGVDVTEDILPGVPHGFTFAPNANVSIKWIERQVDSFARAFRIAQ